MSTFSDIKEVRLTLSEPAGFIDFAEVANFAALPATPVGQTAYRATDTGTYYSKDSGSWVAVQLMVSDTDLGAWFDSFGHDGAVRKAIERILATLPSRLLMVKNSDGAESVEYVKLLDLQKFYRQWLDDLTPKESVASSGRYLKTKAPCVVGGNV